VSSFAEISLSNFMTPFDRTHHLSKKKVITVKNPAQMIPAIIIIAICSSIKSSIYLFIILKTR